MITFLVVLAEAQDAGRPAQVHAERLQYSRHLKVGVVLAFEVVQHGTTLRPLQQELVHDRVNLPPRGPIQQNGRKKQTPRVVHEQLLQEPERGLGSVTVRNRSRSEEPFHLPGRRFC
jgi:imidazolonepropionase-like amidohydrolase